MRRNYSFTTTASVICYQFSLISQCKRTTPFSIRSMGCASPTFDARALQACVHV